MRGAFCWSNIKHASIQMGGLLGGMYENHSLSALSNLEPKKNGRQLISTQWQAQGKAPLQGRIGGYAQPASREILHGHAVTMITRLLTQQTRS